MKNLFEGYISTLILAFIIFIGVSLFGMETQVISARRIHSSVVQQIQNSDYSVDINDLNQRIQEQYPSWMISVDEVSAGGGRENLLITLTYDVEVPLFNVVKEGTIQGYAR